MKTKTHKYKLNAGTLIWREFKEWRFIPKKNKNKIGMDEEECLLIQGFIKEILKDISLILDRSHPFSSDFNDKLFQKTIRRLFKSHRAKLLKHNYDANLTNEKVANTLTESEIADLDTRLYTFNFISERILNDKKGLDLVSDELCYMLRSTDKENTYTFERYGVYYGAHGPKSIKEDEKTIIL